MNEVVLDASAVLALLNDEPGAIEVAACLTFAVISTVNLAEVVAKLTETGMTEREIRKAVGALQLQTVPFDDDLAYQCGVMRSRSRHLGLSLGDRACLALAKRLGAKAVTTDAVWVKLQGGPQIKVVR
jgi:ribonuclease VapC